MTDRKAAGRRVMVGMVGAVGALTLLVTGCTPGGGNGGGASEDAGPVETDIASLGDVTLTVWDQEVRGGQNKQIKKLNKQFEEKYPNVTIDRVSRSTEDLKTTLRLALTGDKPPDVVQVSNGRPDMGSYVEAGLLRNLDPYAKAYGWGDRFSQSVLDNSSYTKDGKTFGKGSLFGVAQMGEMVGVYYNKDKLDELGLEPPETWSDFDKSLAEAKSADELPIQFGNLDQWPGIHLFGTVQSRYVDPEVISDLAYGRPGSSWQTPENVKAAETLREWVEKDYLTEDFNGVGSDPAWKAFSKGEGVYHIGGTWLLAGLEEAMGDSLGFTAFPGSSGENVVATGGTSLPFTIPKKSDSPDAAAAYMDFITNADAMKVISETGNLPVHSIADQEAEGAQRQVFDTFDTLTTKNGMVPYLDYATADSYDVLTKEIQNLMAGQKVPKDFIEVLETEYQANVPQ